MRSAASALITSAMRHAEAGRDVPIEMLVAWALLMALLFCRWALAAEPYQDKTGWMTCPRGYIIAVDGSRCLDMARQPHGATIEISKLPSAGSGALGGRACPSGGCGYVWQAPGYFGGSLYSSHCGSYYNRHWR